MIMCTSLSSEQEALKHWSLVPKKDKTYKCKQDQEPINASTGEQTRIYKKLDAYSGFFMQIVTSNTRCIQNITHIQTPHKFDLNEILYLFTNTFQAHIN